MSKTQSFVLLAIIGLTATCPDSVQATESEQPRSLDEIARELSNPVTGLRAIFNDFEYRTYQGDLPDAGDQANLIYQLKPSIPIRLRNGKNLLLRATIPLYLDQPLWEIPFGHPLWEIDISHEDWRIRQDPEIVAGTGAFDNGHDHLGDISLDFAYGGVSDNGFISMYGIATVLPTNQDLTAGKDHWSLGPEVAFGKQADWGVIGAWATHLTRLTGEKSVDTNETTVKIFFAYGLGNGWQVVSNPKITYDWEAVKGDKLLLPVGGGIAKTTRIGQAPLRFSLEAQYFVVSPDRFGTEWLITLNVTPVLSGWLMR